jgi:voltage-gated potassium channel
MITGIAVLGVLAGSLASFFRLGEGDNGAGSPGGEPASPAETSSDAVLQALTAEVVALRHQVEALTQRLTGVPPGQTPEDRTRDDVAANPLSQAPLQE